MPSQTELLIDLGLEDRIVGITKFCVHPKHLKKTKTIVGGTKQVDWDKIKALNPDIILCNKEENTLALVLALEKIAPVHVSDMQTLADTRVMVMQYATLFNCKTKAEKILNTIADKLKMFETFIANKPVLNVAYFIWKKPWMIAADQTFINHLLEINKFYNVYKDQERYPEVFLEELKEKNIDVVLLSSEPYPFKEKHFEVFSDVVPDAKVLLVDGEYFSWYGSRLLGAFDYFKKVRIAIEKS